MISFTIMSGTGPRESIFPTRMALTNTKTRLKGAQTGHSLLAKKRDALTTRFRAILRKVDEVSTHHQIGNHVSLLKQKNIVPVPHHLYAENVLAEY